MKAILALEEESGREDLCQFNSCFSAAAKLSSLTQEQPSLYASLINTHPWETPNCMSWFQPICFKPVSIWG